MQAVSMLTVDEHLFGGVKFDEGVFVHDDGTEVNGYIDHPICVSEAITDFSVEDAEAGALYRECGWRMGRGVTGTGGLVLGGLASGYKFTQRCALAITLAAWYAPPRRLTRAIDAVQYS
jgi:hypothetical protein